MKRLSASAGVLRFCVSALTRYHSPRKPSLRRRRSGCIPSPSASCRPKLRPRLSGLFGSRLPCGSGSCCRRSRSPPSRSRPGTACPCTRRGRRPGRLENRRRQQAVQLVDVSEPDVLHVVDPVEEELNVRRMPGRCGVRELRDHVVRVHQGRGDLDPLLLLELPQGVGHPLLDADRLPLSPPPHLQRRRTLRGPRGLSPVRRSQPRATAIAPTPPAVSS